MPVIFYPHNPIDSLENIIVREDTKEPLYGEIVVYRQLYEEMSMDKDEWFIWHNLYLPTHSDTSNYYRKVSAQIDFVILCKKGLLILEVKGGSVSVKDSVFYYGKKFDIPMSQDPFKQVEGYRHTIRNYIPSHLRNCLFCGAVAFPHVYSPFESMIHDPALLWTAYVNNKQQISLLTFVKDVFIHVHAQHVRQSRNFGELSSKDMKSIQRILNPMVYDNNRLRGEDTLAWLGIDNIDILEGLYKNDRIMLEGPPGSGKTTLAKAFIDKQFNRRGIYLCWNKLLMHYTEGLLKERIQDGWVEVTTFFRFLQRHALHVTYDQLISLDEQQFYQLFQDTIERLEREGELQPYDFVVVDEAQDIFDRGIALFLNKFSGTDGKGLQNGASLILYDIDQSYMGSGRQVAEIADMLSEHFSHFKLHEIRRSSQCPDIRDLACAILDNPKALYDTKWSTGHPYIELCHCHTLEEIRQYIVKDVLMPMRDTSCSLYGKDCILLISPVLMRGSYKGSGDMPELLILNDVEELIEGNIMDLSNKLRYTSILKYKGLEKKNVILVITEPSQLNKYELFVGITRAICNLKIYILHEESI